MNREQLKDILHQHKLWLLDRSTGKGADLRGADLEGADLEGANLRSADLKGAYLRGANLRGTDLRGADLEGANLEDANLRDANLRGANLRGANLDFSCFPLWCGGKNIITDRSLPLMLSAFICSMKVEDEEIQAMQTLLLPYAQKSHRAKEILE